MLRQTDKTERPSEFRFSDGLSVLQKTALLIDYLATDLVSVTKPILLIPASRAASSALLT